MSKAVVLLSGGLDSTTCLAIATSMGRDCYALSFKYGQRHSIELDFARRAAQKYGVKEHIVANIDLSVFGGSSLTTDMPIPTDFESAERADMIPSTYVPARNTIFLSFALAYAETIEASDIFIGVNALDYSGYPDCRPEFIRAFESMANLASKAAIEGRIKTRIITPLIDLTKAQIIERGMQLNVDYGDTHSCYDPSEDGQICGRCDSCILRKNGFDSLGMVDPVTVK